MRDLLKAQDQSAPPDWAEMISFHEASRGSVNTYTVQLRAEPLYGFCWSEHSERAIGSLGPIEVGE